MRFKKKKVDPINLKRDAGNVAKGISMFNAATNVGGTGMGESLLKSTEQCLIDKNRYRENRRKINKSGNIFVAQHDREFKDLNDLNKKNRRV